MLCISARFGFAEEAHGQRHVQVSPRGSGSPCALDDSVSGDTVLKAQVERKTDPSTPTATSMETPNEFKRPVPARLSAFMFPSCGSRAVFAGAR